MELVSCKYRLRCELGACGRRAEYTVVPERSGVKSRLHLCGDCLRDIARLAAEALGEDVCRKSNC